eukprot:gb/GFBE01068843.1/.p1 GENE.gb/GFBE01068843.1/~~gb/GFBE01068843.1/.p1  ORF type:complete len:659 (+),score=144.98 gb/GFBE01068843.1/:1-1977(+)
MSSSPKRKTVSGTGFASLGQAAARAAKHVLQSKTRGSIGGGGDAAEEGKDGKSQAAQAGEVAGLNRHLRSGFLRKTYQQTRIALALQGILPQSEEQEDVIEEDVEVDDVQAQAVLPDSPVASSKENVRSLSKGWTAAAALVKGTGKAIDHSKSLIQKVRKVAKAAYERHALQKQMMDELMDQYPEELQAMIPGFDDSIEDILQDLASLQVGNMAELGELIVDSVLNDTAASSAALTKLRDRLLDAVQAMQQDLQGTRWLEGQMESILSKVAELKAQLAEAADALSISAQKQREMRRIRSFTVQEAPAQLPPRPQLQPPQEELQRRRIRESREETPARAGTRPPTRQLLLTPSPQPWARSPLPRRWSSKSPSSEKPEKVRRHSADSALPATLTSDPAGFALERKGSSKELAAPSPACSREWSFEEVAPSGSSQRKVSMESLGEEQVLPIEPEAPSIPALPSCPAPPPVAEIQRPAPSMKAVTISQFGDLDLPPLEPELVLAEEDDDFDMIVIGRSPRRKPRSGNVPKLRFPALPMFPQTPQDTPRSPRPRDVDPFATCRSVELAATGTFPAMKHSPSRGTLSSTASSARLRNRQVASAGSMTGLDRLQPSLEAAIALSSGFTRRMVDSRQRKANTSPVPFENKVINWFPAQPGADELSD